jgi:hypothetical protein
VAPSWSGYVIILFMAKFPSPSLKIGMGGGEGVTSRQWEKFVLCVQTLDIYVSIQQCNGTTAGLGYLEVLSLSMEILLIGQLASVRTDNPQ